MTLTMDALTVVPEVDLDAPVVIDREMAMSLLWRAVAEKGENRRSPCQYVFEDVDVPLSPACIVGHVLAYVGVPLETLRARNHTGIFAMCSTLPVRITDDARLVLAEAQHQQDAGASWGDAVRVARRYS